VIDPNANVGRALAIQHGSRWFPDLDRTDLVDAVIIASSTETHRHWVEKALRARTPILVEKPMSTNLDDSRAMVAGAVAAGVPITCGFVERFNPAVMLAMDMVQAPLDFRATRHSPFVSRIRTGVVHDLMIHDADLAIRMYGEQPDTVSSRLGYVHSESASSAEDVAEVRLQFPSGGMATLSASRITPHKTRTIAISELDRVLEIDLMRQRLTIYRHVTNGLVGANGAHRARTVVEHPPIPLRREPLASQLDYFLALIGGAVDADAEGRSVLRAHEALATALAARSSTRRPADEAQPLSTIAGRIGRP
jgi:predicted dehydrogenase